MYADYNFISNDNITYTVDMLRLKTTLTFSEFDTLQFHLKTNFSTIIENEYTNFSISSFKYNYHIKLADCSSYWFGFIHNAELIDKGSGAFNDNTRYNFTIEFNPNKVAITGLIKHILKMKSDWVIKSLDIAMDFRLNILDLCGMDKLRKKDFRMFSCGYDNRTYYMGRTNNRIKIYNKKIESDLDYELTRCEITSKLDLNIKDIFFYSYDVKLPDLYTNNYLYTFKDYEDKTLLAVLYAVQSGFNINDLTRRYRDKVKSLLSGDYRVNLENKFCTKAIKQCIYHLFEFTNIQGDNYAIK